ncbi:Kinesin protein 3 [Phytophthora cinnamomi]|uniref:Kinesin protein 3 n=1 Tax=Phytophthora cinnamomi TaxID=4785 RepID=UPI0035598BFB|nr:Kinesin protein 3 [Phytophthora cinnamomi]
MQRAHVLVRLRDEEAAASSPTACGLSRTSASSVRLEHSDMSPGVASISFEQVFGAQDGNICVFQTSLAPAADAAVDGRAATLVVTGAARSGKSFSCHGDQQKPHTGQTQLGLVTLAIRRVFSELERKLSAGWRCNVLLSCWGVDSSKNEALTDLLAPGTSVSVQDVQEMLLDRSVAAGTAAEAVHLYSRALGTLQQQEKQDFVLVLHVETLSPSGEARRGRLVVVDIQGGSIIEPRGDTVNKQEKERGQHFLDAQFPVNEALSAGFGAFVGGTSATYILVAIQTPAQFQQQAIQSLLYACKAKEIKYSSRVNYLEAFVERKNGPQHIESQKQLPVVAGNQAPGCREDFVAPEAPSSIVSTDRSTTSSDSTREPPSVTPSYLVAEAPPLSPSLSPSTSCESEEYHRESDISRRVRKAYELAKAATSSPAKTNVAFGCTSNQDDTSIHAVLDGMLEHLPRDTLRELTLQTKLEQICASQSELERTLAHETSIKDKCVDRISRLSQMMSCQVVEHEQQLQEALTAKHAAEAQLQDLNIKFDGVGREVSRLQEEVRALKASQITSAHREDMQDSAASDNDRVMLHTLSARLEEAMVQAKDVITFKDSVIQSLEERLQLASKRGADAVRLLAEERSRFERETARLLGQLQENSCNEGSEEISRVQSENMTLQQQKADLTVKVAQLTLELETARSQWAQEAHEREERAEQRCAKQITNAERQLEQATSAMQQQMAQFRREFDMKIARQRVAAQVACKAGELKCDQLERDLQRMKLKLVKQKVKLEKKARALVASAHQQHEEPLAVLQRETEDLSVRMEAILQREQNALTRAYKSEEAVERLRAEVQQSKSSAGELERERATLRNLCKELETDKKSLETEHEYRIREMEESLAKQILAAEARVHEERDKQIQKLMEDRSAEENRLNALITVKQEKAAAQLTRQQSTSSVSSRVSSSEDESQSSDSTHQPSIDELDALIDSKERRYRRVEKRRQAGSSTRTPPSSSPPTKGSSSSLKRALANKEQEVAELSARQKQLLAALATANEQETLAKRQIQETETQRQKELSRVICEEELVQS